MVTDNQKFIIALLVMAVLLTLYAVANWWIYGHVYIFAPFRIIII